MCSAPALPEYSFNWHAFHVIRESWTPAIPKCIAFGRYFSQKYSSNFLMYRFVFYTFMLKKAWKCECQREQSVNWQSREVFKQLWFPLTCSLNWYTTLCCVGRLVLISKISTKLAQHLFSPVTGIRFVFRRNCRLGKGTTTRTSRIWSSCRVRKTRW